MPAEIIEVPLGLRTRFANGEGTHHFDSLPLQHLTRQLLEGFVVMCSPNGGVKSRATAFTVTAYLRYAIRALDAASFVGDASDLRIEHLLVVCAKEEVESALRPMLRAYDEAHPEALHPSVRRFLDGPWISKGRGSEPVAPYTKDEEARIRDACRASIIEIEARVEAARAEAGTGGPYTAATVDSRAHLAWTLDADGPLSLEQVGRRLGRSMYYYQSIPGVPRPARVAAELWPAAFDLVPYRVLLGLETGIVPEGIANLRVDDLQRVSPREVIIAWEKQRGGGRESDRFGGAGSWSPGRIFERAIAITAGLRRHAAPSDTGLLWLALAPNRTDIGPARCTGGKRGPFAAWGRAAGLSSPESPLGLDGRRLRKTFYRRLDEAFGGAIPSVAGINQSEAVAAEHYLSVTQPTEFLEGVVEAAYAEVLAKVRVASRPRVLSGADLERLGADDGLAADELEVPADEVRPLLQGRRDVFAAACRDFYHSPYGAPGQPCPAAVWTCLFCPLAVITPAKLPTLLRLADHVNAARTEMPADEWTRIYGAVWHQLRENILPRYPDAVIEAARAKADAAALYLPPHEIHPGPIR